MLTAPGGFGKTTLLAQCCRALAAQGVPTAWLTLSEDDEPSALDTYLAVAFQRAGLNVLESLDSSDAGSYPSYDRISALLQTRTDRQIGEELGLTRAGVRYHLQHLFAKLKVRNRVDAVQSRAVPWAFAARRIVSVVVWPNRVRRSVVRANARPRRTGSATHTLAGVRAP